MDFADLVVSIIGVSLPLGGAVFSLWQRITATEYEIRSLKKDLDLLRLQLNGDRENTERRLSCTNRAVGQLTSWAAVSHDRPFSPRSEGWPTDDPPTIGWSRES